MYPTSSTTWQDNKVSALDQSYQNLKKDSIDPWRIKQLKNHILCIFPTLNILKIS